ncbi:MAG: DNA polymerase IV [Legionella sp.]|uniref:DNA polymerase IV n=1 Tax=Legionella sp. TaxID=459 RepID=UPI0039E25441
MSNQEHHQEASLRKIIHIDMDCFYAAIEIRDNPQLANKPVAVGGFATQRGVLCTCNYLARHYGVHSAMPTAKAISLCPNLVVLPVNMAKYREVSKAIHTIFHQFTDLVEPLSLDEAYLDVSNADLCQGSATLIAQEIQNQIFKEQQLTASAGVAPNKFLAKIASAWKKPNGLFVITPTHVDSFISTLPINKLFGVGKVTASKLNQLNVFTCDDLRRCSLTFLIQHFGKLGQHLYYQARGIDNRPVKPDRVRKSLSIEKTLLHDIHHPEEAIKIIDNLYELLVLRIQENANDLIIKNQFIKIKTNDFKLFSGETKCITPVLEQYIDLFTKINSQYHKPIRLIGIGVHFHHEKIDQFYYQPSLFNDEK